MLLAGCFLVIGGEKLDETEENLLEHRTDGTDAFDTLYIGREKFSYREMFPVSASGILYDFFHLLKIFFYLGIYIFSITNSPFPKKTHFAI